MQSVLPSSGPKLSTIYLAVLGISCAFPVSAQVDAGALQQQLQREIERERPTASPESLIKKQPTPSKPQSGVQAIEVSSFKVTGITLITQEQAQEVLKPFGDRKLTFDQIKEAGAAVANLYTQIGRVAQATIPPQDVVNGQILIKIIEGKVGDVIIELDKTSPSRLKSEVIQKFIHANNASGAFIDLSGLERSLAILNETPGNEVSGELSQGSQEETSNIQVNAKDTGLFAGRVDASNYGSSNTGVGQLSTSLSVNNPSGNGDQATLDVIGSEGSVFGQFKYGMPISYDGWRVVVNCCQFRSITKESFSIVNHCSNMG